MVEIFTALFFLVMIGVVFLVFKPRQTDRHVTSNINKQTSSTSTAAKAGLGIGTLFILDEIIEGDLRTRKTLDSVEPDVSPEDIFGEDDFDFFE